MTHAVHLIVEKSLGEGRSVFVGSRTWETDVIERVDFFRCVHELYAAIELPFFPSLARIEIESEEGLDRVDVADPVDDADVVALILWLRIVELDVGPN